MTLTDQQQAIRKLWSLVHSLATAYKDYLPHESVKGDLNSTNPNLSPDTRTRLMQIEDAIEEADKIEAQFTGPEVTE